MAESRRMMTERRVRFSDAEALIADLDANGG